ncbi:YggS family pyridoxal phosphate-dependent enzyme [Paraclostridium sordellii]|uniref:YggS family pyridoxal phosphate-dependent enzyme n=1 Tax=Paraclostridium sordellii TaxID=1505 RepID=UPI0005E0A745|nr:YggS family pyridoxal phosphate-dependent enzyme [Paeniclostridium sordellii]MDU2687034.1 YggS family pyridoxal phosphate-dependent enzyme [Paeniclostridium sordellii]MDU6248000.1 YggS family pyridoxal phosphate-dependent enzyme [Paeniclostridium sordellii]MRZ81122.1 YggS family pyridoxal phosphate-dependent enzyme [Paeniclostridium sordellii]MSB57988.1 YggS family pyridoxal phosphate-dependent enzyme [Paeniclostridium sordellii]MVO69940.1 YggS family pyridoxal phosphate-dependent enzyme [P
MDNIKCNMIDIKNKIDKACELSNRNKEEVTLIAVSKTVDVDAIKEAINSGATDFGENKPQELARKFETIGDDVNWHLIGSLQTNKVKYIIDKVYMIHSIDRLSLCDEIQKRAKKIGKTINCLIQVNISKEESKHGILEEDAIDFVKTIAKNYPNIRIKGLMTMAPNTDDKELVRSVFKGLKDLAIKIDKENIENISMDELSMGMSNDFEIAVEEGATFVRVGTSIFGQRNYNK